MAEGDSGTSDDLEDAFERAANHLTNLVPRLDGTQLLRFYSLYKQATSGPCLTPRPGWFQLQARQKWDAWHALGEMSRERAMRDYVKAISEVDPDWQQRGSPQRSWVAVSCPHNDEQLLNDADKTLVDWVKEGNDEKARQAIVENQFQVNELDEDGMRPIHWAADRGHVSIVRLLVEAGADKDAIDAEGQTALHYAASCGHVHVAEFLLSIGASILRDNDGLAPKDVAAAELAALFH